VSKGTVFDRKLSTSEQETINCTEHIAKKYGCKMSQVALAWVNGKIASPIVGLNSVERVDESLVSQLVVHRREDVEYLEEV
jgi:aryl-alcohol dehydrogenase-like predicted oxidoreductase